MQNMQPQQNNAQFYRRNDLFTQAKPIKTIDATQKDVDAYHFIRIEGSVNIAQIRSHITSRSTEEKSRLSDPIPSCMNLEKMGLVARDYKMIPKKTRAKAICFFRALPQTSQIEFNIVSPKGKTAEAIGSKMREEICVFLKKGDASFSDIWTNISIADYSRLKTSLRTLILNGELSLEGGVYSLKKTVPISCEIERKADTVVKSHDVTMDTNQDDVIEASTGVIVENVPHARPAILRIAQAMADNNAMEKERNAKLLYEVEAIKATNTKILELITSLNARLEHMDSRVAQLMEFTDKIKRFMGAGSQ